MNLYSTFIPGEAFPRVLNRLNMVTVLYGWCALEGLQ